MRGKKTDNETIYKIMISMFNTNNTLETSRQLSIAQSTVEKIYKKNKDKAEFVKLCDEKKDEFVQTASRLIKKATIRLEKELDNTDKDIAVNNLTTVIGTLYDKRALAKGDSTANENITIKVNIVDE